MSECRPGFVGDKGRCLGRGNTPVGKAGAVLWSCPERRGLPGPPARLGSSLRRMPPRQRRVLPRQPASGLRRRPVPQLADGAERPRRRAPGRWVWGRGRGGRGSRGAEGAAAALTARCFPAVDEDHNSCRNPDGDAAPWCYIQGATGIPERRSCDIAQCSGKSGRCRPPSLLALPGLSPTAGAGFGTRVGSPRRTNNPGLRLPRKHGVPRAPLQPPPVRAHLPPSYAVLRLSSLAIRARKGL